MYMSGYGYMYLLKYLMLVSAILWDIMEDYRNLADIPRLSNIFKLVFCLNLILRSFHYINYIRHNLSAAYVQQHYSNRISRF